MVFKKKRPKKVYRFYKPPQEEKGSKKTDYAIYFLILMLVFFGISLAQRWSEAKTEKESEIEYTVVRVQILNASSKPNFTQLLAKKLDSMDDSPIIYDIVEKGNYAVLDLTQSLMVFLNPEDKEIAQKTAQFLGIKRENVIYQEAQDNYLGIQFKIILGEDFKKLEEAKNR